MAATPDTLRNRYRLTDSTVLLCRESLKGERKENCLAVSDDAPMLHPIPHSPMNLFKTLAMVGLVGVGMVGGSYGFQIDTNSLPKGFVLNRNDLDPSKTLLLINTLSPSGKYVFGVKGSLHEDDAELHILSAKTFKDLAPPIRTGCGFIQALPRFSTTAFWNQSEDRIALENGGRTWLDVYLVTFDKDKLRLLKIKQGQCDKLIKKYIPATDRINRLYINCSPSIHSEWINKNSVTVQYNGTVRLKDGTYQDFSIPLVWEIVSNSAIRVVDPNLNPSPSPQ